MIQRFQTWNNSQHRTVVPERRRKNKSYDCSAYQLPAALWGGGTQTEPGALIELIDWSLEAKMARVREAAYQRVGLGWGVLPREKAPTISRLHLWLNTDPCLCEKKPHESGERRIDINIKQEFPKFLELMEFCSRQQE